MTTVLFAGLVGCFSSAMASPIPFSFTEYKAQDTGLPDDIKPSPPVSVGNPGVSGASAPDSSNFSAFVLTVSPIEASLQATFRFTATFPAIKINFDYDLHSTASYGMAGVSEATAKMNAYLKDITNDPDLEIWSDNKSAHAFAYYGGTDNIYDDDKSGPIDKVLSLVFGHEYELCLLASADVGAGTISFDYGSARANINNFQLNAVPLPSSFLLLSSGLLGILGYRKRLKR